MVLLALAASRGLAEAPPLPSSRFGEVLVAGAPAPSGTEVSAWLGESRIATTSVQSLGTTGVYRLDVPGDLSETPEREGASEGESVEIRVGGAAVASATWNAGALALLDLTAGAGADLAVQIDDAVSTVSAGAEVDVVATIENLGPGAATGTRLEVELPLRTSVLATSDGGQVNGSLVTWPLFTLAAEGLAARSLRLRLDSSFPAAIDSIAVTARVAHDGTGGADPDPSNDRATDTDLLDASPDLTLTLSDGRESVTPGATIVYRAQLGNQGTQGATGVAASLGLPTGVAFYSASHGGSFAQGNVVWPLFELTAASRTERSVTVRLPADLASDVVELVATADLSDDGTNGSDPDPSDNAASDTDLVAHASDLEVSWVEDATMATDPQALSVSGSVAVAIENRGTLPAPASDVVVFSDENDNGLFDDGIDVQLGATVHGLLTPGASETLSVSVTGVVRFLGDRTFAMVDASRTVDELDEENNVTDDSRNCGVGPSPTPFTPVIERHWPPPGANIYRPAAIDSLSTPLVVQLTDDNGDGLWNELDVPDLVFVTTDLTYLLEPQVVLRAVRGDTLASIFDVDGFFPHPTAPTLLSFSGLAAADIDRDGKFEIISTTFGPAAVNYLRAYEHTGALKWVSQPFHTNPSPSGLSNRDNPTIADLDGDGEVEILVGANVFDRFGHLRWSGAGGQAFQSSGNSGDRGGAISIVADLDLDGRLEVVTGNTVYRSDGEIAWQTALTDGYPAVANFDSDPQPEVVVVSAGTVRLHDSDGALLWGPHPLPGSDPEAGGAPTVGDFDGDGSPEIGIAGSDAFVVLDGDGTLLWQASTQDYSSNLTGATSFDFDGDGDLEIVYRDERRLRVYQGSDGTVLFEVPISSNTWTEEPIVADVDRDGNAEIVVTSDRAPDVALPAGERTSGVFVLGDGGDGWTSARGLWHQHAYVPELVEDDGSVPTTPAWGWLDHNSFRANVPLAGDSSSAPDLTASRIVVDLSSIPLATITVRIGNGGRTPVGPGLSVAFYDGVSTPAPPAFLVHPLEGGLGPGTFVDVTASFPLSSLPSGTLTVVADDDGTGDGRERECDESNNRVSVQVDTAGLGLWLTLDDDTDSLGAGDETTYELTVHNAFPAEASGIVVTDVLPDHTELLAASDGGVETSGVVTWPLFSLPSGESATRSVTLRVAPSIPLAISTITNRASVADDGSQGPDPTPQNNVAIDVDVVTSVTADAGGPYSGPEGVPLYLDGSGSFDRDGTIVSYDWDLDGDGDFGDATGAQTSWLPPDEGVFLVRLRVTDDAGETDDDATTAEIGNLPPTVTAPPAIQGIEGGVVTLDSVSCVDPGDELSATIAWGDGTVETVPVIDGIPTAQHIYVDDGDFGVSLCVSDGSSDEVCVEIAAQVANSAPEVLRRVGFDFDGWLAEELGGGATTSWSVSTGGGTATELRNGEPTLLVGELDSYGTYELTLRIADASDDDFVGLALGVEPGDLENPAAVWYLVDWRRWPQSGATPGLALSEVFGVPTTYELWLHEDQANNGPANGVRELARAATLGSVGWARHTEYHFRIEHSPTHLGVWVDGMLELDVEGSFAPGRLALYDYSQAQVIFTALESDVALRAFEGESAPLAVPFTDAGRADTHLARVDWGDGDVETVAPAEEDGSGQVVASHVYADDGVPALRVCVVDDDGGSECAQLPARVWNLPPRLVLAVVSSGFLDEPVSLDGTAFTDPGLLDSHVATVDWGDGAVEAATVAPSAGGGSIFASHSYAVPGGYNVRVCLVDDDGGSDCSEAPINLVVRALDLGVAMQSDVTSVRPGDTTGFDLTVANFGSLSASGIVLAATLPAHSTLIATSDGGVLDQGVVTWTLGGLAAGEDADRRFEVAIDADAPIGAVLASTAGVTDDGISGPDADPGNNVATSELRVAGAFSPIVELPRDLRAIEGATLALTGATWSDTTANEQHTGTVAWGDGAEESVVLTPSRGLTGAIVASHVYSEDGPYDLTVCVRDAAGNEGCATAHLSIANAPPDLIGPGAVLLDYWRGEQYDQFSEPRADWIVSADGLSVRQAINSRPSIFLSPLPAYDTSLEGSIRVGSQGNWDDDFIGFVLGYRPGASLDPETDYLLVDWKQRSQGGARRGLALSRVRGIPVGGEFWLHNGHVTELARGLTLGDRGWRDGRESRFRFEYSRTRLRLWVDGVLELDVEGDFPDGNFGFYNYSQQDVYYRGFSSGLEVRYEGESFDLRVPFVDLGVLDSHEGSVDWDDGTSGVAEAVATAGFGFVAANHAYEDDGDFTVDACVEDDELARDCEALPLVVLNRPPSVDARSIGVAIAGETWSGSLASFVDPGRLDSHVAEVLWGDGTSTSGSILEDAGAGEVLADHVWDEVGVFQVSICVTDDDGGEGCDSLEITVLGSPPSLRASKTYTASDRNGDGLIGPGDVLVYSIAIENLGPGPVTNAVLTDPTPAHTRFVPGSARPELLVLGEDPVVVAIPRIDAGASLVVRFEVEIASPLPLGVSEIVNSGLVVAAGLPPIATDDPALPGTADPTRTPVSAVSGLSATKGATLIDRDGDGVATPGDEIGWSITIAATGSQAAAGVLLNDSIPEHTSLDAASLATSRGEILSLDPLLVSLGTLELGESAQVEFRTEIAPNLPAAVEVVSNQALLTSEQVDRLPSDDPTTAEPLDPTRVLVYVHPTLHVDDASVPEGAAGSTNLQFLLELDRPARLPLSVDWEIVPQTATPGEDYVPAAGTATISPGDTAFAVTVSVLGDPVVEPDETVRLELSNPTWVRLAENSAIGTIWNDDSTSLEIADAAAVEGQALVFPIALTAPSALPISVAWETADGTATANLDYSPGGGTLHLAPHQTTATLTISTLDDIEHEADETVRLLFSDATGVALPDPESLGTILDDDPECTLTCPGPLVVPNQPGRCGAEVALPEPGTTGTCGPVQCAPASGSFFSVGATLVSCTVEALPVSCSFTVTVDDVEPPSVRAPELIVGNDPGACSASVAFEAVVSDNCPGTTDAACVPGSGVPYPHGTTAVLCTATDTFGNEGAGEGSITVLDIEPPRLETCPDDREIAAPPGALSWPVEYPEPTATDNCPGVEVACAPESGEAFPIGTTPVVCTAVDGEGLVDDCAFEVTVDTVPVVEIPTLSLGGLALFAVVVALVALSRRRSLRPTPQRSATILRAPTRGRSIMKGHVHRSLSPPRSRSRLSGASRGRPSDPRR